jgi:hypothetical protein
MEQLRTQFVSGRGLFTQVRDVSARVANNRGLFSETLKMPTPRTL